MCGWGAQPKMCPTVSTGDFSSWKSLSIFAHWKLADRPSRPQVLQFSVTSNCWYVQNLTRKVQKMSKISTAQATPGQVTSEANIGEFFLWFTSMSLSTCYILQRQFWIQKILNKLSIVWVVDQYWYDFSTTEFLERKDHLDGKNFFCKFKYIFLSWVRGT